MVSVCATQEERSMKAVNKFPWMVLTKITFITMPFLFLIGIAGIDGLVYMYSGFIS